MSEERWTAVDRYFGDLLQPADPILDAVLAASEAGGLPEINVAPNQGALLGLLARSVGAKRILEVGTLGGYSTIWLARALPKGGKVITLEVDRKHADRTGPARDSNSPKRRKIRVGQREEDVPFGASSAIDFSAVADVMIGDLARSERRRGHSDQMFPSVGADLPHLVIGDVGDELIGVARRRYGRPGRRRRRYRCRRRWPGQCGGSG